MVIFYCVHNYTVIFLLLNGWIYYLCNSIYVTAFETIFQKQDSYNHKTQLWLSSGELFSGAFSTILLFLFAYFKIPFYNLMYIVLLLFLKSYWMLITKLDHVKTFHISNNHHIFINFIRDVKKTIKILKKHNQLMMITIMGFIPLALMLIIEQKNMFKFTALFNVSKMQEIHFVFKFVVFFFASLCIPILGIKVKSNNTYLKMSIFFITVGFIFSIQKNIIWLNFIGYILLGFSHYTMLVFRKVRRREIMITNHIFFNSLGMFFAIEGLGGMVSYAFLTTFGSNFIALLTFGITVITLLFYFRKKFN